MERGGLDGACTVRTVEDERVAAVDAGGVVASSAAVDAVVSGRHGAQSNSTSLHFHRVTRRQPAHHHIHSPLLPHCMTITPYRIYTPTETMGEPIFQCRWALCSLPFPYLSLFPSSPIHSLFRSHPFPHMNPAGVSGERCNTSWCILKLK